MIEAQILENHSILISKNAVSDSVKYETVRFSFPKFWEHYEKTAVFKNGETVVSVLLGEGNPLCVSKNECYIPHEVLRFPGFSVSVFGNEGETLATTANGFVAVTKSGYQKGVAPKDPTPDEYSQILEVMNQTKSIAQSVRDDADNGLFKGEKGDKGDPGNGVATDLGVECFAIETDGTIYLKPEYRGSTIDFATDSSIESDLGETVCAKMAAYSKSDNGFEKDGSKINSLPEILNIPSTVNGIKVKKLAPAMFAYNKRVKQIVLPQGITTIPHECFAYAIHLESVKNVEGVTSVEYGSFFASGILELDLPELTSLGKKAFNNAGHLKRIHLGKIAEIPTRCFEYCTNLEEINHDKNTKITKVGSGAFFYTNSLKKADFVEDLIDIGSYAFNRCALNFNWLDFYNRHGSSVKYGTRATPIQSNPSILTTTDFNFFNMETKACELPAPLRIEQSNPEWADKPLGNADTFSTGCMFFSVMNAYCGMRGLNYSEPYSLVDINNACPIPDGYIKEETDGTTLNAVFTHTDSNHYPARYGEIVKYVGNSDTVKIQQYTHPTNTSLPVPEDSIAETNNCFINGHNYRLCETVDKVKKERTWTWVDLGTRELTTIDLFSSGIMATTPQWYKNLGVKVEDGIWQTPAEFSKIIKALQNGSYVVINVPRSYNSANGHAMLLYGVKANGEVLFVDSSVPPLIELEDYRAITGSMLLQNLVPEGNGVYQIISECETKTLLNETVDNKLLDFNLFMEALAKMNISIMKMDYKVITQTETVEGLTFSYDFEPKVVFFNTLASRNKLYSGFPELSTGVSAINCILGHTWIKANICDNLPEMSLISSWQKDSTTTSAATLKQTIATAVNQSLISVAFNSTTGKWDVTIGGRDYSASMLNRIIGGSDITYNLFVAG